MVVVVLLLPLTFAPASAQGVRSVDVIVVLEDVAHPSEVAREHRVTPRYVYEHALTGFAASIPEARLRGLQNDPRVAFVSEDRPVQALAQTTPTGVSRIDASDAPADTTGAGVRVAIIDTGIDSNHPDLVGNLDWDSGYNCISPGEDPEDDQGHGTHVAGTVAASDNDEGVIGVAPEATLVAFKVLDSSGSGSWASVICGIDGAADPANDIDVANLSLGGPGTVSGTCGDTSDAMYEAICEAVNVAGVSFTVAAGNDSQNASGFLPAAYPEVITVSAYSDTDGTTGDAGCSGPRFWPTCDEVFAPFSNYGAVVDVIAPGVNIESTTYGGGYGEKSGTSMAAPHVAGLAALVLQEQALDPAGLEAHLRDTGQCPDGGENAGSSDCSGQWDGDPDSWTEPMGNAVFATATNDGGDTNQPPAASFSFECTDPTCSFDGSGSSDSDGTIASYAWDFGDGDTATGATASHTYSADGTYIVTLTVTDDDGATDSASQSVTVVADDGGDGGGEDPAADISLTASGYKVRGVHHADLSWGGASSTNVDVYRDGSLLTTTANDDAYTDDIGSRGGATYTYQVCEAATTTCSSVVTVEF